MVGDPFLNYLALGILISVVVVVFYGIIAIHDIPARLAAKRHHPHEDAIHAAGWVSLFTLHVIWPFLWIWAMMYRPDRGWGFSHGESAPAELALKELDDLRARVSELESAFRARTDRADLDAAKDSKGLHIASSGTGNPIQVEQEMGLPKSKEELESAI
jgi:hypothetical protein